MGAVKADLLHLLWYDFAAYNKLRNAKFRCFHETKQTQNEVERFLLRLGRICFRILLRQSENFSDFCKVLSQSIRFSQHDRTVLHVIQRARALKLPSISHTFFDVKSFYKILPLLPICYRQISLKRFWY